MIPAILSVLTKKLGQEQLSKALIAKSNTKDAQYAAKTITSYGYFNSHNQMLLLLGISIIYNIDKIVE